MSLNKFPELSKFFTTYFSEADAEQDLESTKSFLSTASTNEQQKVLLQAKELINESHSIVEDLGMQANRWFGDAEEAQAWVKTIIGFMDNNQSSDSVIVKDSNGATLADGDAVTVIKDLKVKGGTSDLKRGTLVKKIRLIGDPENIECNVNGSTLVLKTCFLKKA